MKNHYPNLIVGGGPAGLNLALEFSKSGIDYLLLEGSEAVGGQWDRVPVCGQLISLNKKYVPGESHTYRMRYDWHTLSSISEEDARKDPKLRFTEWSSEHWPCAKTYKKYLQYLAKNMGLASSIRTHSRVTAISRPHDLFVIEVNGESSLTADRIFCGTGKSEALLPDVKGLNSDTCTMYEDFDPVLAVERYRNKIVAVIGRGNSAFEIAHFLVGITAETRILTKSLPKFARQSHNVHDIRAQVADVFDLMQLKSNNNIVSDRIVEVTRIPSGKDAGRLLLRYDTACPHWTPPRWLRRTGMVDEIIVCSGFNYTMADIFDMDTVRPLRDEKGKYCLLNSTWESVNVPGLYFIGAPTRTNDPDAASGFVHGFRCNILALGQIVAEKYHAQPLRPVLERQFSRLSPSHALEELSAFLVKLVSTTMPLFELFGYFASMVTFEMEGDHEVLARVWPPFPRQYNKERWGSVPNQLEVVFEYGFHRYGDGALPTHYFTLPADHFDTSKSAYIHPVFHVVRDGIETHQFHMQESLIGRWDMDDYVDPETNVDQYRNTAFNACAAALGWPERRSMLPVLDEHLDKCYPLMTPDEVVEALRVQPTLGLLKAGPEKDMI
ncbi:NAD(P)-binding domain-containing protein [Variovorax sp. UMC13]|uniref:NAD(P)-binding domain-containing protein n=1 Tax=Variovorax sp. UMC13 TaxID=1862326 RepID=UPI0015FF051A|nr:NAD(P)-binding domain-containing protein [Variovorax sp. UMC13]